MRKGLPIKNSGFSIRLIFITVIIGIATAIFTLGYFVGRNTSYSVSSVAQPTTIQKPDALVQQQEPDISRPLADDAPAGENKRTETAITTAPVQDYTQKEHLPVTNEAAKEQAVRKATNVEYANAKSEISDNNGERTETDKQPAAQIKEPQAQNAKSSPYAVQVGAFKNHTEAENLRIKLEGKSYKAYIKNNHGNKHPVYKVLIGSFDSRKSAEIFALQLKKTEGITAFAVNKKNTPD